MLRCPVCFSKNSTGHICNRCRKRKNMVAIKIEEKDSEALKRYWGNDDIKIVLKEMIRKSVQEYFLTKEMYNF